MDKELQLWKSGTKSKNILFLIVSLRPFYNNDGGFKYTYKMKSVYDEIRFSINPKFQNEKTFSSTLKKLYALESISVDNFEEIYFSILNAPVQKSFISSTILLPLNIKLNYPNSYNLKILGMDVSFKPISEISINDLKLSLVSKVKEVYQDFTNYISDKSNIIIEIKSIETLAPVHFAQVLTYLKLADLKLGLLINFNTKLLKEGIHRVVNNL